jgi:hypothetical protein
MVKGNYYFGLWMPLVVTSSGLYGLDKNDHLRSGTIQGSLISRCAISKGFSFDLFLV